jgi:DMSO/TMAO reductase YedYZ heme-binding membrane subunit
VVLILFRDNKQLLNGRLEKFKGVACSLFSLLHPSIYLAMHTKLKIQKIKIKISQSYCTIGYPISS